MTCVIWPSLEERGDLFFKSNELLDFLYQTDAKEHLSATVKKWHSKLNVIEDEKTKELFQIRSSLKVIEENRDFDSALLKSKVI